MLSNEASLRYGGVIARCENFLADHVRFLASASDWNLALWLYAPVDGPE